MMAFGPNLWLFDGPTVTGAGGFLFPTRMVVIRLPGAEGLWIWSPIALTDDMRAQIDTLGPVSHLVAPNCLHYTFLADWAQAYPTARIHAAPGLTEAITGCKIDTELGADPAPDWAGEIDQSLVIGNRITTETIFFHRESATVLITDLVQHLPSDWYRGWRAAIARLDRMTGPAPSVPRKFRLATTGRSAARAAIAQVLDWPARQLVMAHGAPVTGDAGAVLDQAFHWLMR